jgi:transglycosylase-like protein with SLT domain
MSAAEGLVQAVGSVLGTARDSFGVGGAADAGFSSTSASAPPTFAAADFGSGQAVSASSSQSDALNAHYSALGEQDLAANASLQGALDSRGAGLGQMNDVITGAAGDVTGLAPGSNTSFGLQALVNALVTRLEQAFGILTVGNTSAATQAAGSAQVAAGYNGLVSSPGGGVASTGALSSMGGLSTGATQPAMTAAMQGMTPMMVWVPAAAGAAASTAAGAAAQAGAAASSPTPPTNQIGSPKLDPLDLTTVTNDLKQGVGAVGETAARGYINTALNHMGITDTPDHPNARNTWMTDLLHGMVGESSYNPSALDHIPTYSTTVKLSDGAYVSCARGILQCIPTTFAANHQAGTSSNIYDPVANICAAMWYVHNRYGVDWSGVNLASKVQAFRPGASDPGY